MTSVRCNNRQCGGWFSSKLAVCPDCGTRRPGFNKYLRTAKLNNQLYAQAESADREKRYADAVGL